MGERLEGGRDASRENANQAGATQAPMPALHGGAGGPSARGQSAELNAATGGGAEVMDAGQPSAPSTPGKPEEGQPDWARLDALATAVQARGLPLVRMIDPISGEPSWRLVGDEAPRWNLTNFPEQMVEILSCGLEYRTNADLDALINRYFVWIAQNYPVYPEDFLARNPTAKAIHKSDGDPRELMRALDQAHDMTKGAVEAANLMGSALILMSTGNIVGLGFAESFGGICAVFDGVELGLSALSSKAAKHFDYSLPKYQPGSLGPNQLAWYLAYVAGHDHHIDRFFAEACGGVSEGMKAAARTSITSIIMQKGG